MTPLHKQEDSDFGDSGFATGGTIGAEEMRQREVAEYARQIQELRDKAAAIRDTPGVHIDIHIHYHTDTPNAEEFKKAQERVTKAIDETRARMVGRRNIT